MLSLHYSRDRTWSQLDSNLWACLWCFQEVLSEVRRQTCQFVCCHPKGWSPGLNKREKIGRAVACGNNVASHITLLSVCLPHHDGLSFQVTRQRKPFFHWLTFFKIFFSTVNLLYSLGADKEATSRSHFPLPHVEMKIVSCLGCQRDPMLVTVVCTWKKRECCCYQGKLHNHVQQERPNGP